MICIDMAGLKEYVKWSWTYLLIPVDRWFYTIPFDICQPISTCQTLFKYPSELGLNPPVSGMSARTPSAEAARERIFHSPATPTNERRLHSTNRIISKVAATFYDSEKKLCYINHI